MKGPNMELIDRFVLKTRKDKSGCIVWTAAIHHTGYGDHRGTRHGMAKLTEAQVLEIRRRRDAGERLQAIADDFGVDMSLVSLIGLRKIWRHLP
jgi:hypothetical protein